VTGTCQPLEVVQSLDASVSDLVLTQAEAQSALQGETTRLVESSLPGNTILFFVELLRKRLEELDPRPPAPLLSFDWYLGCRLCRIGEPAVFELDVRNDGARSDLEGTFFGGALVSTSVTGPARLSVAPAGGAGSWEGTFTCLGYGAARIRTTISYTRAGDLPGLVIPPPDSPIVTCHPLGLDALMLSENVRLTRSGSGWAAGAPGVTANVIHATDTVLQGFHPANFESKLYGGITSFQSNRGLTPLTLRSSRQTGTATHNGTRYVVSGLTGSAVWGASDGLTVSAPNPDGGADLSLTVPAPGPLDPNLTFGPRSGLSTEVRLADGTFDVLFVSASAGPAGAPAGTTGLLRTVRAADMQLSGTDRVAPLVDEKTITAFADLGWTVTTLYVAAYREQETDVFFPGLRPLPVQAGRMFQLTAAELNP
jgi:hypothetical protein